MTKKIALLHPGEMGVTIGASLLNSGTSVAWVSHGRSKATQRRANEAGFTTYDSFEKLLKECTVVVSVCPPSAAVSTAVKVAATEFNGVYVDANAVSPNTATRIAAIVETTGASYVDGSIIGPPAHRHGTTRLYLSGVRVREILELFLDSAIEAIDIGESRTAASALKMCYAAWTKGSSALLISVGALAKSANVDEVLYTEWNRSIPDLHARLENASNSNAVKAWRFEGEMHEIADTFKAHGLTDDFFHAAARTYSLLSKYKDTDRTPNLDDVLRTMLGFEDS